MVTRIELGLNSGENDLILRELYVLVVPATFFFLYTFHKSPYWLLSSVMAEL